ncbi:hypothetical protein TrST_g11317 [Triparma strigata]|uniref:Membrane insertase YidC/Oxa/ALB C-terminal domain-containing protein n=1 Tax=Triparma strigata TaxID=1606541 RepID=A0A9W7AF07_9STRA|nr:hypothetical protein TrST_g11317 [Triparma strigata]
MLSSTVRRGFKLHTLSFSRCFSSNPAAGPIASSWYNPSSWGKTGPGTDDATSTNTSTNAPTSSSSDLTIDTSIDISSSPIHSPVSSDTITSFPVPDVTSPAVDLSLISAEFMTTLPESYWPSSLCEYLIHTTYVQTGCPYWQAIVGATLALRVGMTPIAIRTIRNTSRMQHMNPEMKQIQERMKSIDMNDPKIQQQYRAQMQALFKKYDCNPMKSLALPFVQMPIFMGMFFGLKGMPDKIPELLEVGGPQGLPHILGSDFSNLVIADASYILPLSTAATFLLMIEMGADGMQTNTDQAKMMKNVFRGLGVLSLGFTSWMPQAVFMYWVTNNFYSLGQTIALKNQSVRDSLGIWKPPKPVPGAEESGNDFNKAWSNFKEQMEKAKEGGDKEILEGKIDRTKKVRVEDGPKLYDSSPVKGGKKGKGKAKKGKAKK